jgi:acetylornithine/N-succinyldiaminopimelate aminotransferase
VLDTIEADNLLERAGQLGDRIANGLEQALAGNNAVQEIRHSGLMIAVEMASACPHLVEQALAEGVLINVTRDNVVRLLPPLVLSDEEADELVARVSRVINNA